MNYFGSRPIKKLVKQFDLTHSIQHDVAFGWGRKASFYKAQQYALKQQVPCVCLEDGFIRSLGLGKHGYPPLSIVFDRSGIYFDCTHSSDLENLILQSENETLNRRAASAIQSIINHKITKYNQRFNPIPDSDLFERSKGEHILLVDQTLGDQSIRFSGANADTFKTMLAHAHHDHPQATIWIKTHPDVIAGKAQGHFSSADFQHPYVKVMTIQVNPLELLQHFSEVYVVSSHMGFEALLLGKKVHCFGMPWYAGWGITEDRYAPQHLVQQRRTVQRSLMHLFACAYFQYSRYISPVTHKVCELDDILKILITNIQFQQSLPTQLVAYKFSPWKKKFISDYLAFPNTELSFKKYAKPKKDTHVLAWGKQAYQLKQAGYKKVITVEDGFIRSVGLGANLIRPCSLVFDDMGIYYDATCPSRIENLLNHIQLLTVDQEKRIDRILSELKRLEISKYNVGEDQLLERPVNNKKVILVVGQVEDDMSIQLGGVDIKTNLQLLKQVRSDHPDAYIIYKPHPDVETGLRVGKIDNKMMLLYANQIERTVSIQRLFNIVDELHTISSLSGFEALVRGLKVYCYGLPFYAGWGLTIDRHVCERRNNRIDLKQLTYVTLIEYPNYNLAQTTEMDVPLVNPEDVIHYIDEHRSKVRTHSNVFRNLFAKTLRCLRFWKK
ncbi:capsular polysaccharide biosynthesis protein [Acinetobacter lanii]|uniref:Capsular polysaccharide biosynthesis protein n=1 Tax=Acinetobacter lanii TaxID=2715163 RepID=A0A6G8S7Y4_9GAMM|nr:capsular polysaccharide biosynthesis protein [Acinetobacter lanii]QIO10168.1 capsular polysaccharide biosynthesis protein [Acinetobacter lanii]